MWLLGGRLEHWEPRVFELLLKRVADDPTEVGWHRYIALRHMDKSRTLIGTLGGFRKAERPEECEVGYSVLEDFQGKGYATEGTKALYDSTESFIPEPIPTVRNSALREIYDSFAIRL